jgi:hypothetical protein
VRGRGGRRRPRRRAWAIVARPSGGRRAGRWATPHRLSAMGVMLTDLCEASASCPGMRRGTSKRSLPASSRCRSDDSDFHVTPFRAARRRRLREDLGPRQREARVTSMTRTRAIADFSAGRTMSEGHRRRWGRTSRSCSFATRTRRCSDRRHRRSGRARTSWRHRSIVCSRTRPRCSRRRARVLVC